MSYHPHGRFSHRVPDSRIGNHPFLPGGSPAIWRAGYDIGVTKRRGRWESASFHGYLMGGRRVLAAIGQGAMCTKGNTYQFAPQGKYGRDQWVTNSGRAGGEGLKLRRRQPTAYLSTICAEGCDQFLKNLLGGLEMRTARSDRAPILFH